MIDQENARIGLTNVLSELAAKVARLRPAHGPIRSIFGRYFKIALSSRKLNKVCAFLLRRNLLSNAYIDARQFLSHVENVSVSVYRDTSYGVTILKLDSAFIHSLRQELSSNPTFVEFVADRYLRVDSYVHYEISEFLSKVIADLLTIVIPPPLPVPFEVDKNILEYVAVVRDDLCGRPYPIGYVVSSRWREITKRGIRVAGHTVNPQHIALLGMARWSFDAGMPLLLQRDALGRTRSNYIELYPELSPIGESPLALPGTTVVFEDVAYSPNLDQTFGYYHEISSGIAHEVKMEVVAEIGSGYGRLARILYLTGRAKCLVFIDLPESLATCYAFLRVHFPRARTKVIKSKADIDKSITENFEFIFCPIQELESLELDAVDLLINTYSFGEMQQRAVNYLLDWTHRKLRPKHLFSLNTIFTDKNIHFAESGNVGEGNEIVLNLQPEWWPRHMNLIERSEGGRYRNEVSIVLERVTYPLSELIQRYQDEASKFQEASKDWVMYMFFAALWTSDVEIIREFLSGLRQYHINCGFARSAHYDFDKIGEVQFLKRRLTAQVERPPR